MDHLKICGSIGNQVKNYGHKLFKFHQVIQLIITFQEEAFQEQDFGQSLDAMVVVKIVLLEKVVVQDFHVLHMAAHRQLIQNSKLLLEQVMETIGMTQVKLMDGLYHIQWYSHAKDKKLLLIVKV